MPKRATYGACPECGGDGAWWSAEEGRTVLCPTCLDHGRSPHLTVPAGAIEDESE